MALVPFPVTAVSRPVIDDVFLGIQLAPTVAVTVTGSPGNTVVGLAEQAIVIGGRWRNRADLKTKPALKRAMLMLPRPDWAKVLVHVLVVCLENANREAMI